MNIVQLHAAILLVGDWEPKDEAAYARGELVEPKQPIVYYIDPATPEKWRPYLKQGVEDWRSAFEKAGFKNAIYAKDPPSKEERSGMESGRCSLFCDTLRSHRDPKCNGATCT